MNSQKMPLSEFLRLAVEKLESGGEKQCWADPSSRSEKNLAEVVHEDVHFASRIEKKSGGIESSSNNILPWSVDVSQENETNPWFYYPINESLQDDHTSLNHAYDISSTENEKHFQNFLDLLGPANAAEAKFTSSYGEIPPEQIVENEIGLNDDESEMIEMSTASLAKWVPIPNNDAAIDAIGFSSSVGSRNSGDEHIETESVIEKKAIRAKGTNGSKRGRTAEIHNLCEKRRRRRINEKMKAFLQLVPNCSKSDKATMLDEAIEYLKSLKHQVQILSVETSLTPPNGIQPTKLCSAGTSKAYVPSQVEAVDEVLKSSEGASEYQ